MSAPRRFLLRFLLVVAVLGALAYRYEAQLVKMLLPVFKAEMQWLDDTYRIDRLAIDTQGADQVIRVEVGLAHCIVLSDHAFCPDPRGHANASTLVGNVSLPAVLLVGVAVAWPARRGRERFLRILVLPLALSLLWALDVPMILWASIWSLHVDAFAPDLVSPLLIWRDFLQSGGRLALAGALSLVTVAFSAGLRFSHQAEAAPAPH